MYCLISARSTKAKSIFSVMFDVVRITTLGNLSRGMYRKNVKCFFLKSEQIEEQKLFLWFNGPDKQLKQKKKTVSDQGISQRLHSSTILEIFASMLCQQVEVKIHIVGQALQLVLTFLKLTKSIVTLSSDATDKFTI